MNGSMAYGTSIDRQTPGRRHSCVAARWFLSPHPGPLPWYLFTVVGTARCAVRAAFSGASTWPGQRGARSVPPAARGRGRRSAASLPANYVRTVNRYRTGEGQGEGEILGRTLEVQQIQKSPQQDEVFAIDRLLFGRSFPPDNRGGCHDAASKHSVHHVR